MTRCLSLMMLLGQQEQVKHAEECVSLEIEVQNLTPVTPQQIL